MGGRGEPQNLDNFAGVSHGISEAGPHNLAKFSTENCGPYWLPTLASTLTTWHPYWPETPTSNLTELTESIGDALFQRIIHNPYHVLDHLLPETNIRPRHHNRQLSIISGQLHNQNFIYRMLFRDCY